MEILKSKGKYRVTVNDGVYLIECNEINVTQHLTIFLYHNTVVAMFPTEGIQAVETHISK